MATYTNGSGTYSMSELLTHIQNGSWSLSLSSFSATQVVYVVNGNMRLVINGENFVRDPMGGSLKLISGMMTSITHHPDASGSLLTFHQQIISDPPGKIAIDPDGDGPISVAYLPHELWQLALAGNDLMNGHDGAADEYQGNGINGFGGNDTINGLGGNDVLGGGDGDDAVNGGLGDDQIYGGNGSDTIHGNEGNDNINGDTSGATLNFGNDIIYGDAGTDILNGEAGDDELHGGSEDDAIYGGTGADTIFGGEGNDNSLNGGDGNDVIWAGADGDTYVVGEAGNDTIHGEGGNDNMSGGANDDTLYGEEGDDILRGDANPGGGGETSPGNDTLYGGAGLDTLYGDAGNDSLHGEADADTISGGDGNDTIHGGDGNDIVYGTGVGDPFADTGTNTLFGDAGDDTIYGGQGIDIFDGGEGSDIFHTDGNSVAAGDAIHDTGLVGVDTLMFTYATFDSFAPANGIEQVQFALAYGSLSGTAAANSLDFSAVTFIGTPIDFINGQGGNDVISGNGAGNELRGGDGDDRLKGGGGNDTLSGGTNDARGDTADWSDATGAITLTIDASGGGTATAAGIDTDTFTGIENVILGSGGDLVTGNGAFNLINGRGGNDTLNGGGGNDKLIGGLAADTLAGGAGVDLFYFAASDLQSGVRDTITDHEGGVADLVRFDGIQYYQVNATAVSANSALLTVNGAEVLVSGLPNGNPLLAATSSTTVDPNGIDGTSRANLQVSGFDWAGNQSFTRYTELYNSAGERDRQFGSYDGTNGSWDFLYDVTNTNASYATRFDYFNNAGQNHEQQGTYDGSAGSYIQRNDVANAEIYTFTITYYNTDGQPTQVQSFYDAIAGGGSGITTFDPTGTADYSSYTTYYDSHGHADQINGVYDTGPNATWYVDFYQDAPADPRDYLTVLYNSGGGITQQWITMDNGTIVNL